MYISHFVAYIQTLWAIIMDRLILLFISILTISSGCTQTICDKANKKAIDDFNAGQYSLHSREVLPAENSYFFVLRQQFKINWHFTDSLDYYECYDSTMLTFINKKYQIDVLTKARRIADSLERTPNWTKTVEYPGGMQEVAKFVIKRIKTNGLKTNDINGTKVFIQFNVDTSGQVQEAEIIKGGINKQIDKQIVDIVSSMTEWSPAYQFGQPIKMRMVIPLQLEFQ